MKKRTPIFRKILLPLMLLTIAEILVLVITLFGQGLIETLNQTETDVMQSQVEARKTYIESEMINYWMRLDDTVTDIVAITEKYMSENNLSADALDDSTNAVSPVLTDITNRLITMMRANRVTGAYVIFNTEKLSETGDIPSKPGVYIRDHDPASLASDDNEDLFLMISSKDVMSNLSIPTDSNWDIYFRFSGENEKFANILRVPFNFAYSSNGSYTRKDMGRWDIAQNNDEYIDPILTYTVPFVLSDGTVAGVIGIDITFNYLDSILPYDELGFESNGAYILAKRDKETNRYFGIYGNGNTEGLDLCAPEGLIFDENYYMCTQSLHLYESNAPFSNYEWVIAGLVKTKYMQSAATELVIAALIAIAITLIAGVLVSMLLSYRLQKPIAQIEKEIASADPKKALELTPTGIREIDAMSGEITKLSADVLASGRKFSKIIEMSSVRMAGFQINLNTRVLFLTDGFFRVFGEDLDQTGMTAENFEKALHRYDTFIIDRDADGSSYTVHVPCGAEYRYIRIHINKTDNHIYGLAEDVTRDITEKQLLQHERDHDSLTNIYNRRAFRAKLDEMFAHRSEELKHAALIMLDLDNLKYFNDTFGHEYGDQYIISAADAIQKALPENAFCARISGDEFNVFLYGYSSQDKLDECVARIQKSVNAGELQLPDGSMQTVHATGGVAFYPEHSGSIETLLKYADYAMYVAKRNNKRSIETYDAKMYGSQDIQLRNSDALTKMLQYNLVHYAFQPIVDVRTGKVFAYEALMRPDVEPFFTVAEALDTARREGKLVQVEEMTLFNALEAFDGFMKSGSISKDTHLFVNSISNQCVSVETGELFVEKYGKYAKQLVLEITEEERIDQEIWALKEHHHRILGGKVALDDYGSGYNSEVTLLVISPEYIKIDMTIVRDIHTSKDKQQIVDNIVRYAHDRGKFIIAEGTESEDEVKKLIELNVDYMQGYFFGKPELTPQKISPDALKALGL